MNKILKFTTLIVVVSFLAACSTTSKFDKDKKDSGVTTHRIKDLDEMESVSYENKMKAKYNQVYYYPFDNSILSSEDLQSIKIQSEYLAEHPGSKVFIAGHTDSRGSAEYNMALGERRAKSVVNVLLKYGVARSQIKFVSYGEEKPAVIGDSEAAYKWNRRAELKYEEF